MRPAPAAVDQLLPGAVWGVVHRQRRAPARSGLNLRAGVDGDLFGLIEFYAQVDSAIAAGGNGFSAAAGVRMAW